MRFDLEIEVTDILTQVGKDDIGELFFSQAVSASPAIFNSIKVPYIPEVDTSRYNLYRFFDNLKNISSINFRSRVQDQGTLNFSRLLIKHGALIPFFSYGTIYFNRYPVLYSNDSLRVLCDFDTILQEYKTEVPSNIDMNTLSVTTNRISDTGTADIDNIYKFTDTNDVQVVVVDGQTPPTAYKRNTIFITTRDGIADSIYRVTSQGQLIKVFEYANLIDAPITELYRLINNGMALVDRARKLIIVRNNNTFYDYRRKILFSLYPNDYQYTIEQDVDTLKYYLYLNTKQQTYTQSISEQNILPSKTRINFFQKYPLLNVITSNAVTGLDITSSTSFIRIKNTSNLTLSTSCPLTGILTPIICYSRGLVDPLKDIKHVKVDISPKSINFGDGTICFASAELTKSQIPDSIVISYPDGPNITPMGSIRVKVKVLNIDGVPLTNVPVTLTITNTLNGAVQWGGNAIGNILSGTTNLAGELIATIINTDTKLGNYIQKEWIGDVVQSGDGFTVTNSNIIYLPYALNTTNINNLSLFFITGDDPILAQIKDYGGAYGITADKFTSPQPYDYFGINGDISSYTLAGRKIAYVSLQADTQNPDGTYNVTSKFIKPLSIQVINTPKQFIMRKLYLYNQLISMYGKSYSTFPNIITDTSTANFTYSNGSDFTITSPQSSGFNINWELINNTFSYCNVTVNSYTKITYQDNIPGVLDTNVLGYFLRIEQDSLYVPINAYYSDNFTGIELSQDDSSIYMQGMNYSESAFQLSTEPSQLNSYLGAYSYLTLSEYLNGTYGSNFTCYVCKYSGRISNQFTNNRCNYPDTNIQNTYYIDGPDSSNLYCKHSVEYDATLPSQNRCPKLDAQLINPFILYQ